MDFYPIDRIDISSSSGKESMSDTNGNDYDYDKDIEIVNEWTKNNSLSNIMVH